MAQRASWKARWDNSGLYVYAKVQDATPGVDTVAADTAYPVVDGVTVLFGDDARDLQSTDSGRPGDVAVTLAATAQGISAGRASNAELTRFTEAPEVVAQVVRGTDGYVLEARLPWRTLGQKAAPRANTVVALCVLVTDGNGDAASRHTISGCQNWSGWDGLHPGSWQRTILSLDE
jgi:hypothetical protein